VRPDLPPGRYDAPSPRARVLTWLLAVVVAVAVSTGAYLLYARYERGRLPAQLTAYDVRSDSLVRISFEVTPRGHRGECKVTAKDRSGVETGSRIVQVAPTGKRTQRITVDVPTTARAVNGELVACRRL
jgi:hypothetical protein